MYVVAFQIVRHKDLFELQTATVHTTNLS